MWEDSGTNIDGNQAAAIAAAMREVALADGESHHRELALIDGFRQQVPEGAVPSEAKFPAADSRAVFVKSLVMVGLADGTLSECEVKVIEAQSSAIGASTGEIDAALKEVKEEFLAHFKGVKHFADQVSDIASELMP